MWRPKNWFSPYLIQENDSGDYMNSRVFEAGADAMLEALRVKELPSIYNAKGNVMTALEYLEGLEAWLESLVGK